MADIQAQHYENYMAWDNMENPLEQAERQLEEQRRVIIKWMDDDLRSGTKYEKIKWELRYDVVWNIWIAIYKWEPNSFYKYTNWKVEYYTNLPWLLEHTFFYFWLRETWYEFKDWKLSKNWQEIPQFITNWNVNPEFVKAISDIDFYAEIQDIFWLMKSIDNWKKVEWLDGDSFNFSIIRWVSRIEDVMYFYVKWYLNEEETRKLLLRAIEELPNQCSDTRFYKNWKWEFMWLEVTKIELDAYLTWTPVTKSLRRWIKLTDEELKRYIDLTNWKPLITQKVYDECLRRIEARDKKINDMNWVKKQWQVDREIWKTQIWVVWKVLWILGINN